MKKLFFTLNFLALLQTLTAQNESKNVDGVYKDNIASIKFIQPNNPLSFPMMDLKGGSLVLSFDDLDGDIKDYVYTVQLCNQDWTPTQLEFPEYAEGFLGDRINKYQTAFGTFIPYMHYELSLPNDNIRLTKSGNYILKVFEDMTQKKLLLSRRFIVIESVVGITQQMTFSEVTKYNTHQEFDFIVNNKNFRISNPQKEIKANILQNGRWDNAKLGVPPLFIQGDNMVFDYQDTVVFAAGKQFRYVDVRSYKIRSERVRQITRSSETWDFELYPDLNRSHTSYISYPDANGAYVIANEDNLDNDTKSDYVNVHFSIPLADSLENTDVYLYGQFTDWQMRSEYKLHYSDEHHAYEATMLLKQGYYNYLYVTQKNSPNTQKISPPKSKNTTSIQKNNTTQENLPDFSTFEGDWYETENEYYIFIYYRPFGFKYDRVIGVKKFSSTNR
jgi:hypothetical protein